jgi:hypothetical protein
MAEVYKILGQIATADSKEHVLYQSPAGTQTIVTNITATNRTSSSQAVDINYYDDVIVENDLADVSVGTSGFAAILGSQGSGSNIGFSTDAITWTSTAVGQQSDWHRIAFGGGKYVAIDQSGQQFAYSTNGTSWTTGYFGQGVADGNISQIAYANGVFSVVINSLTMGGAWPIYSTDGATWTRGSVNGSTQSNFTVVEYNPAYFNLAYGNGVFVTTTNNSYGAKFATSTDGISWTQPQQGGYIGQGQIAFEDFQFVNGYFVGVSSNNYTVAYSTDGTNWSTTSTPQGQGDGSIAYAFSKYYVALGSSLFTATALSQQINWSSVQLPQGVYIDGTSRKVGYDGNKLVFGGDYNTSFIYTTDGTSWASQAVPNQASPINLINRGGMSLTTYSSPVSKAIYKSLTIAANDFEVLEPGIVMQSDNTIVVKGTANTTFSVYGTELS